MKIFKIIILITIFLIIAIIHVSIWLYFFGDLIKTDLFWKIIYMCSCFSLSTDLLSCSCSSVRVEYLSLSPKYFMNSAFLFILYFWLLSFRYIMLLFCVSQLKLNLIIKYFSKSSLLISPANGFVIFIVIPLLSICFHLAPILLTSFTYRKYFLVSS